MCTTGRPAADAFSLVHITLHPVLKTIIVPWLMPKSVKRNYTNLRLVNIWTCGSTPGHVSESNTWPIVPESFRRELFNIIHLANQDTCCLEWPTLRCPLMDTHFFLANSLKFKDTPRPTADIWPSGLPCWGQSHWHYRSISHAFFLPSYLRWSLHSLHRSDPRARYDSRILCPCLDGGLDRAIWYFQHHYVRPCCSVWVQSLVVSHGFPGYKT